jgi:anti-anti-sigma factor
MCSPDEFSVVVDVGPDATTVLHPVGELDLATAPKLREALGANVSGDVVVDLSRLSFIDSTGLNVLVDAYKRLTTRGHQITLRAPAGRVMALLEITGLDAALNIERPADAAREGA